MIRLLYVTVFYVSTAWGQSTLLDPNGVLPELRKFSGTVSFDQAFQCGDRADMTVLVTGCTNWYADATSVQSSCTEINATPVERSVYNCSQDSVSFLLDLNGDSSDLSRQDYVAASANVAEVFLRQVPVFSGYVSATLTLNSLELTSYTLARGTPQARTVPAMHVHAQLGEPGMFQVEVIVTVIQNVPGVAQIVRFRLNQKTWFLVNEFAHGGST